MSGQALEGGALKKNVEKERALDCSLSQGTGGSNFKIYKTMYLFQYSDLFQYLVFDLFPSLVSWSILDLNSSPPLYFTSLSLSLGLHDQMLSISQSLSKTLVA